MVYNLKYIYASSALLETHSKYLPPNLIASFSSPEDHKGKLIRSSAFKETQKQNAP